MLGAPSTSSKRHSAQKGQGALNRTFTIFLIAAMILGIVTGLVDHSAMTADQLKSLADALGLITTVFLRLIKMIIAPLVFATLVVGIAHMEDAAAIGRVGARSLDRGAELSQRRIVGSPGREEDRASAGRQFGQSPANGVADLALPLCGLDRFRRVDLHGSKPVRDAPFDLTRGQLRA